MSVTNTPTMQALRDERYDELRKTVAHLNELFKIEESWMGSDEDLSRAIDINILCFHATNIESIATQLRTYQQLIYLGKS